jgi:hypothetical protein
MHRRMRVGFTFTSLMVILLSVCFVFALIFSASITITGNTAQDNIGAPPDLLWGPYLSGTTSTGTVINARTNIASSAAVEYTPEAYFTAHSLYDKSLTDSVSGVIHHIPLTGLEPGTTYHYRLIYEGTATRDFHFRTFPSSGPFTYIVYSDTQDQLPSYSQYERYKLVADSVAAEPDVAFILHCGDEVADGSSLEDWNRYFDIGRQLMAQTTIYPALGNHEKNNALYYDAFGLPPYYSFECSNAHFTVLDSINDTAGEADWLSNDLAGAKAWKFVSFHYPVYTSEPNHFGGWENLKTEWENLFINGGVDAVWNGHIHNYERYLENGIQYMVVGTGGGPMYPVSDTKYTGFQNGLENSLAYARVRVDPQAGKAAIQIIRVADISSANPPVVVACPPETVYESFILIQTPFWDLNNDHAYNIGDLVILGQHWGQTGVKGWIQEDLNSDGAINIGDVVVLGLYWGLTW